MDTKIHIVEGAAELFFKKGIRSVTMNEVAEALGISKRTLYEHFSNKDELLARCINDFHRRNLQARDEIFETSPNLLVAMHRITRRAVTMIQELHPGLSDDLRRFHPAVFKSTVIPLQKEGLEYNRQMIESGINAGYFLRDIDPELSSILLDAQLEMINNPSLLPPNRFARVDAFQHIISTFLRGIATEKGLKEIDVLFGPKSKPIRG